MQGSKSDTLCHQFCKSNTKCAGIGFFQIHTYKPKKVFLPIKSVIMKDESCNAQDCAIIKYDLPLPAQHCDSLFSVPSSLIW